MLLIIYGCVVFFPFQIRVGVGGARPDPVLADMWHGSHQRPATATGSGDTDR